jgi:hypothetical protein
MKGWIASLLLFSLLLCPPAFASDQGKTEDWTYSLSGGHEGRGAELFRFFHDRFQPEEMTLVLDGHPDETGRVRHLFLDARGAFVDDMRLDHIVLEAFETQFNAPELWDEEIEVTSMLAVYSEATLREEDINTRLREKQIGDDDAHWQRIGIDFGPDGVHASGLYRAKFLFTFDILIEIDGQFDLVRGRQVWLSDYTLKINRREIPESLAKRAISQLQPILDLDRFIFPLRLASIEQDDEKVTLRSRHLPTPFRGITYRFVRDGLSR